MSQDKDYDIIDKNYDKKSGELQSFLILNDGQPELKNATPENYLLYIEGLYSFLNGDRAVVLSEKPSIVVAPTGDAYSYILSVDGETVETTPGQAEDVLDGVKQVVESGDWSKIQSVHKTVLDIQVRRKLINQLYFTFSNVEQQRIKRATNGWLIDGFYLVNWQANLYSKEGERQTYDVRGGSTVEVDKTHELVKLDRGNYEFPDGHTATIGGNDYTLSERELLFLTKVKWVLGRTEYHGDIPFWKWIDETNNATPEDYDG